jgi:NADH:ubiquinone oxidoreductase subunit
MSFGTRVFTWLHGELVGTDEFGNRYYLDKRTKGQPRERRWVLYKGIPEASKVPPEWHAGCTARSSSAGEPCAAALAKPHEPNLTGTDLAYRPPGPSSRRGAGAGDR